MKYRCLAVGLSLSTIIASAGAAEVCTVVADAASGKLLIERGDCPRLIGSAAAH